MSIFTFKQFKVNQSQSAMKVGTDSLLLGCLLQADYPKRILDIGTGTGLLALMMAQRFVGAQIDAVEIDTAAANEARSNFTESKWSNRLQINPISFQQFVKSSPQLYQLIVSNPPYYKSSQHITIPDTQRANARYDVELTITDFLKGVYDVLTQDGSCWIVLPKYEGELCLEMLSNFGFYPTTNILIAPIVGKKINRMIICFGKVKPKVLNRIQFTIYEKDSLYTAEYRKVTDPFLLWLNQTSRIV
jgi:tRNA1Val (adenine37-N6)-methyltransferase